MTVALVPIFWLMSAPTRARRHANAAGRIPHARRFRPGLPRCGARQVAHPPTPSAHARRERCTPRAPLRAEALGGGNFRYSPESGRAEDADNVRCHHGLRLGIPDAALFRERRARGPEEASSGCPRARARALSRKPPWRGAFEPSAKHRRGMPTASVSRRRQSRTPTARVRNTPFA